MYRACSRCGKIHDTNYKCNKGIIYKGGKERDLRKTYKWKKKSIEIREDANYLCEVCKDNGIINYKNIEVHHINKLVDNPDELLENENLISLCSYHHKQADKGLISKEYLQELVAKRMGT